MRNVTCRYSISHSTNRPYCFTSFCGNSLADHPVDSCMHLIAIMAASSSLAEEKINCGLEKRALYVCYESGSDESGNGTEAKPFESMRHAVRSFKVKCFGDNEIPTWESWQQQPWLPEIYVRSLKNSPYKPFLVAQLGEGLYREMMRLWFDDGDLERLEKELCIAETELAKMKRDCHEILLEVDMRDAFDELPKKN